MKGLQDITKSLFVAISDNNVDKVLAILEDRNISIDVDKRDEVHGLQTTLMRMCHMHVTPSQRAAMLDVLAGRGPDVNVQDGSGRTALCHACIAEKTDVVEFLLARFGADPNVADSDGNTALIYAVRSRNPEVVKSLFTSCTRVKINPDLTNLKGQCALFEASKRCDSPICKLLVEKGGADTSMLDLASVPPQRSARTPRPSTPRMRGSPTALRRVMHQPIKTPRDSLQPILLQNTFRGLSEAHTDSNSEPNLLQNRTVETMRFQGLPSNLIHQDSTSCNSLPDLQEELHEETSDDDDDDDDEGLDLPLLSQRSRRNSLSMPDLREDGDESKYNSSLRTQSGLSYSRGGGYDDRYPPYSTGSRLERRKAPYTITEEEASANDHEKQEVTLDQNGSLLGTHSRLKKRRGSASLPDLRDCISLVSRTSDTPESLEDEDDIFSDVDSDNCCDLVNLQSKETTNPPYRMPQLSLNHQVACSLPDINKPRRQGFAGQSVPKSARSRTPMSHTGVSVVAQKQAVSGFKLLPTQPKIKLTTALDVSGGRK